MNSSSSSSKVTKTTNFIKNLAKFVILKVRKFSFLGWGYLILFTWLIFGTLQQPKPPVSQIQNQNLPDNPISFAIEGSPSKAYKTGNEVVIRWDAPVFDTSFRADHGRISARNIDCQLDFCTLNLSGQVNTLRATWTENGEQFSKEFRLSQ